jgi:hypothetical protein
VIYWNEKKKIKIKNKNKKKIHASSISMVVG